VLKLLKSPWGVLKRLIGLLVPAPSGAKAGGPDPGTGVRWVVHVLIVVAVVIVLATLNQVPGVQTASGRMGSPILRRVWLPLLFLLFYALGWLIWWFWQLMRAAPEESPFPDIDRAWEEAKLVLSDARVGLGDAPLFLLLGRPDEGEESLFTGMSTVVAGAPSYAEAPLHVYATREAIYVTCAGASLLGAHCRILAGDLILSKGAQDQQGSGADTIGGGATIRPDDLDQEASKAFSAVREVGAIEARARKEGRGLTKAEQVTIRRLKRLLAQADRPQVLHAYAEEVERQTARLRHLGRLIARDRRPFCGVNGILLLIPMAATDNEPDAHETGVCCQEDLATAREAMQVQCPVFALVCGLEQVPGFDAFISHFSPEQLRHRVGQRFPLVPDIAPAQVPAMIDGGVKWLGLNVFPSLALPHWRLEVPGVSDLGEAVRANAGLFHFLSEIRERQGWVSRILKRGVAQETFGGCYFAATGRGSDRDQAFLRAMFSRLLEEQDFVSWAPDALAEEESYHRLTRWGYASLALLVLAEAAYLARLFFA
jgi:hypothetical protein